MTITLQTVIEAAALLAAIAALVTYIVKAIHWFDRQKKQDGEIKSIKSEMTLLTWGILACLRGLKEQGCNGPVTEAIGRIEKHLNLKAHEQEEEK